MSRCLPSLSSAPAFARQFEMGGDHIGDIDKNGRGALLAVIVHRNLEVRQIAAVHRLFDVAGGSLVADLVAADRLEADRLQHMDFVHDPADRRLPVDSFEDAARRRRRHHVVGDALHLHFGPGETSALARNKEFDAKSQRPTPCSKDLNRSFIRRLRSNLLRESYLKTRYSMEFSRAI